MPLFEVAILKNPTKKERDEETRLEELILAPTFVVAKTGQAAAMRVTIDRADLFKDQDVSRLEVLVRPFK